MPAMPNFNGDFGTTVVSYNGVNFIFPRVRYGTQFVESESKRTQKYVFVTIIVSGYLRHPETDDKEQAVKAMLAKLQTPGQQFIWSEQGKVVIQAQSCKDSIGVSPTSLDDVLYGPKPRNVEVITNWRYMTQLRFTLTVCVAPITQFGETLAQSEPSPEGIPANQVDFASVQMGQDVSFQSNIIDNVVAVEYSIDQDHRTVRSISGKMTVAGGYGNWFDGGADNAPNTNGGVLLAKEFWGRLRAINANRFISQSFAAPPSGFVRLHQTYRVMEDGVTLQYSIIDREVDGLPYGGASYLDVGVSIEDEEMQLGSVGKVVWGSFELPPSIPDTYTAVCAILTAVLANYVISDPEALVWIFKTKFTRSSWLTNSWEFEFHCTHQVQLLYQSHFAQVGIFAGPLNNTGTYSSWAKPYGDAGLAGNGYSLQQITSLGDLAINSGYGITLSDTGAFQDGDQIGEDGVTMFREEVHVYFEHNSVSAGIAGAVAGGAGGTAHRADITPPAIYICWFGYKSRLNADPLIVFPEQRFNILPEMDGKADAHGNATGLDKTLPSPSGDKKTPMMLPARVVARNVFTHVPEISKLSNLKLYGTEYRFLVALSSVIVNQFLAALTAGTTIENFPFPATLDGVIDAFTSTIASGNPKVDAGDGPQPVVTDPGQVLVDNTQDSSNINPNPQGDG